MPEHTLEEQVRRVLGVDTSERRSAAGFTVGVAVSSIARQDPNRLVLELVNLSLNEVFVLDDRNVSATRGYRLGPGGGTLALLFTEDFNRVGHEWFAIATAAASAVLVVELRTLPLRGRR